MTSSYKGEIDDSETLGTSAEQITKGPLYLTVHDTYAWLISKNYNPT